MKSLFFNCLGSIAVIDSVLVSKCMFSGARNKMVLHYFAYFVFLGRHVGFKNGRHLKSSSSKSFESVAAVDLVLESKCMFSGARNLMLCNFSFNVPPCWISKWLQYEIYIVSIYLGAMLLFTEFW